MVIRLNNFLQKLEKFSYVAYKLYHVNNILFITLYCEEELEKYVITEPVSGLQRLNVKAVLDYYKQ